MSKPRILQSVQTETERTDGQKRFRGQWKHLTKTNVTATEWLNKLKLGSYSKRGSTRDKRCSLQSRHGPLQHGFNFNRHDLISVNAQTDSTLRSTGVWLQQQSPKLEV